VVGGIEKWAGLGMNAAQTRTRFHEVTAANNGSAPFA
jgi:hypothetical protein